MKTKHVQHLYWRIGFGILPTELEKLSKKNKKAVVNGLINASKTITPLKLDTSELDDLLSGSYEKTRENIKKVQTISRQKTKELNVAWVDRLAGTKELLREKMTLFWANHFVCEDNNYVYSQQFHNTLRTHALGNFKDFVMAISKEAAMTKYLNTKQNRKQKPNENFARELMELFTLGVGHYTEDDIKESARAFTGYSHNLQGGFVFRKRQHDESIKTFFGRSGNFNGDDIVNIILENKQCAKFICRKMYRYFVNDIIDENHVNEMADVFYADYNIENIMRYMMLSDWFYDEKNIGTKIKSPIEFLVGIKKIVPVNFKNPKQLLYIQKLLGQILLNPPNVAGWKGGRNWIDSNTIVMRLKLPSLILNNAYISKAKKGTSDIVAETKKQMFKKKFEKRFKTESNWSYFNDQFKNVDISNLENYMLACTMGETASVYLESLSKVSKQEHCVQLMSLPEYQMC
ncbi:DUF1800 domain-containing protein [Flavivirga amylovorans]|uniref:DUF1800 domain-containing protein n=1 Tax=Flavivirga amylovorans TaxID=870486 RepID=A0ABT8X053_9FLAO|nr:DUF1800 domain-containing protein [Flavivirga amylovorans]MDO5987009.1 DUF1800 domain-containing protein [Flavivirga amylovorans]